MTLSYPALDLLPALLLASVVFIAGAAVGYSLRRDPSRRPE